MCPSGRVCRFSDAAFAKYLFDSPNLFTQGHIAKPPAINLTNWDGVDTWGIEHERDPNMWHFVGKVGRTTGETWAHVTTTCANVNVTMTNKTMLCQYRAQYTSAPGDSGAPVIYPGR